MKPGKYYCRNCGVLVLKIYHFEDDSEGFMSYALNYCSNYCFTARNAPKELKYIEKPKWFGKKVE